jgi:predicted RecA/RadA family phage recombinase
MTAGQKHPGPNNIQVRSLESNLTHPTHADGFVDKGDIVLSGTMTGVALTSAEVATDIIGVDQAGVYAISVAGVDNVGNSPVGIGDSVYFDLGVANVDAVNGTHLGWAQEIVVSGATTLINVKLSGGAQ